MDDTNPGLDMKDMFIVNACSSVEGKTNLGKHSFPYETNLIILNRLSSNLNLYLFYEISLGTCEHLLHPFSSSFIYPPLYILSYNNKIATTINELKVPGT